MSRILGIDPSLRKTGLCIFDAEKKTVIFDRLYYNKPFNKDFFSVFYRTQLILDLFLKFFNHHIYFNAIAIETPLPLSSFSSGISSLTSVLLDYLTIRSIDIYGFNPAYLKFILGKKYTKHSELVQFVKSIINEENITINIKRFSDDEAVAFIYAFRIGVLYGYKPQDKKFLIAKEKLYRNDEWQNQGVLQRKTNRIVMS